jgi:hypothetical protein
MASSLDLIAFDDRWAQQDAERAAELRIGRIVLPCQLAFDLFFARHEIQCEHPQNEGGGHCQQQCPELF